MTHITVGGTLFIAWCGSLLMAAALGWILGKERGKGKWKG